ncbi:hypothetical protein [Aquabacterium sp.]|uniref:hypothetical protein n=1 Tax=Aquabacterium sp. TaxID=1872578 RepID=UPI0025BEFC9E|nr:hypothetical protein [Aquabacterium sp.]
MKHTTKIEAGSVVSENLGAYVVLQLVSPCGKGLEVRLDPEQADVIGFALVHQAAHADEFRDRAGLQGKAQAGAVVTF